MDGEAPGLLQFKFHWFFSSYGSGRSLNSLGGGSVEKNQLRYTTVISDGDANTISRLNSEHPYGSHVVIQVSTLMVITYLFLLFFDTFRRWSAWDTSKSAWGKKLRDLKKKTFVDDSGQVRKIKWAGRTLDRICHQHSIGLLWRGYPQFPRGRGWNVQSDLGTVPPLNI